MKKAFAVSKVLIVVVIFGLLITMTTEGKYLLQKAVFLKDLSKIRKIEKLYFGYMTKQIKDSYWSEKGYESYPFRFYLDFISKQKLLKWEDIKLDSFPGLKMYIGGRCGFSANGYNCTTESKPMYNSPAIYFTDAPESTSPGTRLWYGTAPKKFVCMLESAIDDRNLLGGNGGSHNFAAKSSPPSAFNDCQTFGKNKQNQKYSWNGFSWKSGTKKRDDDFMWYVWLLNVPNKTYR